MPRYTIILKPRPGRGGRSVVRGTIEATSAVRALDDMRTMGSLTRNDDVVYAIPNIGRFQYNKGKGATAKYKKAR